MREDALLVQALEEITSNELDAALRTGSELAERRKETGESIAPVTSAMMVHNIELMRGNRPPLAPEVEAFLRESPVAAPEHINLPRYRKRLRIWATPPWRRGTGRRGPGPRPATAQDGASSALCFHRPHGQRVEP